MPQLLCHLFGDYVLQSDWMAQNKTKAFWPAWVHAWVYSLPFALIGGIHRVSWNPRLWDLLPWFVIFGTHFLIDRYRLARYVVYAKNWLGPKKFWYRHILSGRPTWTDDVEEIKHSRGDDFKVDDYYIWHGPMPPLWACPTGYPPTVPPWMAVWLLIIADNTLHLTINYLALRYL